MIKNVETQDELDKAYDLICQLHEWLSFPIVERVEYDRRLELAVAGGYKQYVLYAEGKIVALVGFRILNDLLPMKRLFIDDLVVDEKHRKNGYGTKLLDFVSSIADQEKCTRVDLVAALRNSSAIQAYESQNFERVAYLMKRIVD